MSEANDNGSPTWAEQLFAQAYPYAVAEPEPHVEQQDKDKAKPDAGR